MAWFDGWWGSGLLTSTGAPDQEAIEAMSENVSPGDLGDIAARVLIDAALAYKAGDLEVSTVLQAVYAKLEAASQAMLTASEQAERAQAAAEAWSRAVNVAVSAVPSIGSAIAEGVKWLVDALGSLEAPPGAGSAGAETATDADSGGGIFSAGVGGIGSYLAEQAKDLQEVVESAFYIGVPGVLEFQLGVPISSMRVKVIGLDMPAWAFVLVLLAIWKRKAIVKML